MRLKILLILVCMTILVCSLEAIELGKNPLRAMLYSTLLPGGGQVYNQAYIKSLVVVGLQAYLINSAVYNNDRMEHFKELMDDSGSTEDLYYQSRRNHYKENLRSDYWWIGTVMVLSVADAFVDAHLYNFKAEKNKVHLKFEDKTLLMEYQF